MRYYFVSAKFKIFGVFGVSMNFFFKNIFILLFLLFIPFNCFSGLKKTITGFFSGGVIGAASSLLVVKNKKNDVITEDDYDHYRSFDIKPVEKETSMNNVTFNDIVGIDDAIEEVKTVVDFLQYPEKYKRLGAKIPKGILLQGPPGNGKTLLARAIANETNCNFFYESGSAFVEMYVGVGAKRIRELFDKARKSKPAIIFIDEIDAVAGVRRDAGSNEEYHQTLIELLCQLDGFNKDDSIIVIAATNKVYSLDKALMRPGRFTKIINISKPNKKARQEILEFYINKLPRVEIKYSAIENIAQKTLYFSAADLENLVNEATLNAVKKNSDKLTQEHFSFALEKTLKRNR